MKIKTLAFHWKLTALLLFLGITLNAKNNDTQLFSKIETTDFLSNCDTPIFLVAEEITTSSIYVSWLETSPTIEWEIRISPTLEEENTIVYSTSSSPFLLTNLESGTSYTIQVKAICETENSIWSEPLIIKTTDDYCSGDHFYLQDHYGGEEIYEATITPPEQGQRVLAFINDVNISSFSDIKIHDGESSSSPIIGQEYVEGRFFKSTDFSGALTFVYEKKFTDGYPNWDISFFCEEVPTSENTFPLGLTAQAITEYTATLSWWESGSGAFWEVMLINTKTDEKTILTSFNNTNVLIEGLEHSTKYISAVRTVWNDGFTEWSDPVFFTTDVNSCEGITFYDDGGPNGNYSSYSYSRTFMPHSIESKIKIDFINFDVLPNHSLEVYDGLYAVGNPLFVLSGNQIPDPIVSTHPTGALTISMNDVHPNDPKGAGWKGITSCVPIDSCEIGPINVVLEEKTTSRLDLSWIPVHGISEWELELNIPEGNIVTTEVVDTNFIAFEDLTQGQIYEVFIRPVCGNDTTAWQGPFKYNTAVDYCENGRFYDRGGPNLNYTPGESYTSVLYPSEENTTIEVSFNYLELAPNDYLRIYNGTTTDNFLLAELTHDTDIEGLTFLSTNMISKSLTIEFVSSEMSPTEAGWDMNVSCVPISDCPQLPVRIDVVEVTHNEATIEWNEFVPFSEFTVWEVEIVEDGIPPMGYGNLTNQSAYTASSLESGTYYRAYVRLLCETSATDWVETELIYTTPNYCNGDHFYDKGGPNSPHSTSSNYVQTIWPDEVGNRVVADFQQLNLGANTTLKVYNGATTEDELIVAYDSNSSPIAIYGTNQVNGALTFEFQNSSDDDASAGEGWDAIISCAPLPGCDFTPSNITINDITMNEATIKWNAHSYNGVWEVQLVERGEQPTGTGVIVTQPRWDATGLPSNHYYDVYVRMLCEESISPWSQKVAFNTLADYCGGDHFYDNGGPNTDSQGGVFIKRFSPNASDEIIVLTFNDVQLAGDNAKIQVFHGNSTQPQYLIAEVTNDNYSGVTVSAGEISGLFLTGKLTMKIISDSSESSGWDISVDCQKYPSCKLRPDSLYAQEIGLQHMLIDWAVVGDPQGVEAWEVFYYPADGNPALSDTITITEKPYLLDGLDENTAYYVKIRNVCDTTTSIFSSYYGRTLEDLCGTQYLDSGGADGPYANDLNYLKTFYPLSNDERVRVIVNEFHTSEDADYVNVYDGPTKDYPLLYHCTGTDCPTQFVSTDAVSGALTFEFITNGTIEGSGWDFSVQCTPKPICGTPSFIRFEENTGFSIIAEWDTSSNQQNWEIEVVPTGQNPTGEGVVVNTNSYLIENLSSYTGYDLYIRSDCGNVASTWKGPFFFETVIDYCAATHFYDTGGPNGDYEDDEYYNETFYPSSPDKKMRAIFHSFSVGNNDKLRIYDGESGSAPLLYTCRKGDYPIQAIATNSTGALTFRFESYSTDEGWDISFVCDDESVCENPPSNLIVIDSSRYSIDLAWDSPPYYQEWELEIVPQGSTPQGQGVISAVKQYTFNDLIPNTAYNVYLRGICEYGTSVWTAFPVETSPDYCAGDHFYDSGGEFSNYSSHESTVTTIYPHLGGTRIRAVFNLFDLGDEYDTLKIYSGTTINDPLLYACTKDNYPQEIVSQDIYSGALTFEFTSNSYIQGDGWDILINCEYYPNCNDLPSDMYFSWFTHNSLLLDWHSSYNLNSWEIEAVPSGQPPLGQGVVVDVKPYLYEGLNPTSDYDFYIRGYCDLGPTEWVGPFTMSTAPDYCGGQHFYDTGGPDGDYQNDESYEVTIYPNEEGQRVYAIFNSFETADLFDQLKVYGGPSTNSPLLYSCYKTNYPNQLFSPDEETGALTFKYSSTSSNHAEGWDISIECGAAQSCPNTIDNVISINETKNSVSLNWYAPIYFSSWEVEAVLHNQVPTYSGSITTEKPYTVEGLLPGFEYDFYIRGFCEDGASDWVGPFSVTTVIDYCEGSHFYDTGGPDEEYQDDESYATTIYPGETGERLRAIFNACDLELGDTLTVHNGPDTSYPILVNCTGGDYPVSVTSTEETTGALTFAFISSAVYTANGWDISFSCEPMPDCVQAPTGFAVVKETSSSITLEWNNNDDFSSWEIEILPWGNTPQGSGIIVADSTYLFEGLDVGTDYAFYLRGICEEGNSSWVGPLRGQTTLDYCGGEHFYDLGGPNGNYPNNANDITTIYPDQDGQRVRAIFNSFSTDAGDKLIIYDGPNVDSPLIFECYSNNYPQQVIATSTTGALTFAFTSSIVSTRSGWDVSIVCEPIPTCAPIPNEIHFSQLTMSSITASWEQNDAFQSWEVEMVESGSQPTQTGVMVTDTIYTFTDLQEDTNYDFYIRGFCEEGASIWIGPLSSYTIPNYCEGVHFYDTGGPDNNYGNNQNYSTTIYPSSDDLRVKAIFHSFKTQSSYDQLVVYNGPDDTYPLLYTCSGHNYPETLTSTEPITGALTFVFRSGSSYSDIGWDISFECEQKPGCLYPPTNIATTDLTISSISTTWESVEEITGWEVQLVLEGDTPANSGTITSTPNYTFDGLISYTNYDFYIKGLCDNGESDWIGPITMTTLPDYCAGDHFYDTGGPDGGYQNSESYTVTIYPDEVGDRIKAIFNSFVTADVVDKLRVYDGPDTDHPLVAIANSESHPDIIYATSVTGALTFKFNSGVFNSASGWDISIVCEPMPDCEPMSQNFFVAETAYSSVTLDWDESGDFSAWEIEVVEDNDLPIGEGVVVSNSPYTVENLTSNSTYDFYIRGVCAEGVSDWVGPITASTPIDYCGGDHFYDTGGPDGDYGENEDYITTITPDMPNHRVRAIFNDFDVSSWDVMYIYDGPDDTYPLVYECTNFDHPEEIAASDASIDGSLTFVFNSSFIPDNGWDISIVCEPNPACSIPPSDMTFENITDNAVEIDWVSSHLYYNWTLEVVPQGTPPTGEGLVVDYKPYTYTGLQGNTTYDVYINGICAEGSSIWNGPFSVTTAPDYCGGDHFYDTGGPDDEYDDDENYITTIYPDFDGGRVRAIFNSFYVEDYFDSLYIYDGPDSSYPLLYGCTGFDYPSEVVSSAEDGSLSFLFVSDWGANESGWDISIVCEETPNCGGLATDMVFSEISGVSTVVNWSSPDVFNEWEIKVESPDDESVGWSVVVSEKPYTFTNLSPEVNYDFYIRGICPIGVSEWTGPYDMTTPIYECIAEHFYDTGGENGSYGNNENYSNTFYPIGDEFKLKATFNSFNVEANDHLLIYDGPDDTHPLLYDCYGVNFPNEIVSSAQDGSLTFVFSSNASISYSGWDISFECENIEYCASHPENITLTNMMTNALSIEWEDNSSVSTWEVVVLPANEQLTTTVMGISVSQNNYTANGLEEGESYHLFIRAVCEDGNISQWKQSEVFTLPCNTSVPYFEDFASDQLPTCWKQHGDKEWLLSNTTTNGTSTLVDLTMNQNTNFAWVNDAHLTNDDITYLQTPTWNLALIDNPALRFGFNSQSSNGQFNEFALEYWYEDQWQTLFSTNEGSANNDWEILTFDLSALEINDSSTSFRFSVANNNTSFGLNNIAIDNVQFAAIDQLVNSTDIKLNEYQITCYPNPTHNEFTLSSTTPMEVVQLIDAMGKTLVQPTLVDKYSNIIDLSDYAAGLYFVKVTFENGSQTTQAIVKE